MQRISRAFLWLGPVAIGPLVAYCSYLLCGHYLGKSICIISGFMATLLGLMWGLHEHSPKERDYFRIAARISAVFAITVILILTR